MKILMVSNDKRIANPKIPSSQRMVDLGGLTDELAILVLGYTGPAVILSDKVRVLPTGSKFFSIFKLRKISKKIFSNSNSSDWLITCQDPFWAGLGGFLISKATNTKLQIQIHTDVLNPFFKKESFLNFCRFLLAIYLIPKSDSLRVVSQRVKESIKARFKGLKVFVLPIFVDAEAIRNYQPKTDLHQKYPNFDFIILMASRLSREKNISMALETMREVAEQYPKTLLLIVGDGPEEKKLKAKSCKLKANVIFEPWKDDLVSYYKTADVYLLTSNYEGYGRTVIEAIAAGCPVVMTDVGLAGDIVKDGDNGIVVPVGNKEKLYQAIVKVLEDGALDSIVSFPSREEYLANYKKTLNSYR